jgi:hypothetical protein
MTDKEIKELYLKRYLKTIQSLRSDEYNYKQHENIVFENRKAAIEFSQKVLDATKICMDEIKKILPQYKIEGIVKDSLLKLIKDAIDYDSERNKISHINVQAYSKFHETLITSRMLFVSKSELEFLTFFNRKLMGKEIMYQRAILGEDIHEYNSKADFSKTEFRDFEKTFLEKIQLLSDENIFFETFKSAEKFSEKVLGATSELMKSQIGETRPGYIVKDALLKLIKDAIDYDSRRQITEDAYLNFHQTLITSKILFVSKSDLEFLTLFNEKVKEKNIEEVKIDEKKRYSKNDYFKLKFFEFSPKLKYAKQFHYLVHSVHNTKLLPNIFNESGIHLKGNFNKDYHGMPLTWFGTFNQESLNTSRYGSLTFKIDIDKVLAKGRNYFAMGTRIYPREHSHSVLITNREQIQIRTKLKKTDYNKKIKIEKFQLSEFEHNFPRIVNIEANELCKKVNNEWFLNDGLDLDDSSGDWDHPEFCLEANEESFDNNDYAKFNFDDF